MKILGQAEGGQFIVQMSKLEISKFCGSEGGTDYLGSIYIGNEYSISSVFDNTTKAARMGAEFATQMNYLLQRLNEVQSQTKQTIKTFHDALPYAQALADVEVKATYGGNCNTRKVTLHENPKEFECGRHD